MKKTVLFISVFFLSLISYFLFLPLAHAISQTPQAQSNNTVQPNTTPDVPNNLHNWTQIVMIEVMSSLTCQIAGVDPINPKQPCLGINQLTGKIGFLPKAASPAGASAQAGGAIGFMGNMISMLYTPPLHTSDYFQNLAQNFGITKKTYAATDGGTGFQSLIPLVGIWTIFRNFAYLILVIVFVVVGLAIMLRVKVDPRTVMTIQNQIPKIIVGILAVTFSFAITGFLIDIMWTFIYLTYGIFTQIPGVDVTGFNPSIIQGQSALGVAGNISPGGIFGITHNGANSVKDTLQNILGIKATWTEIFNPLAGITNWFDPAKRGDFANWAIDVASYITGFIAFKNYTDIVLKLGELGSSAVGWIPLIGGSLKSIVSTVILGGGNLASSGLAYTTFAGTEAFLRIGLPYVIAYLVILIALLVALFKLWFSLLSAYVSILINVILAPIIIIAGMIPGSSYSFSGWLRSMAVNLLAFPIVIFMFMLGKVLIYSFSSGTGMFIPPLIGNPSDTNAIGSLIGIGVILLTPHVVDLLKEQFKLPKSNIGALIRGGYSAGSPATGFNKLGQIGLSYGGLSTLTGKIKVPWQKNKEQEAA